MMMNYRASKNDEKQGAESSAIQTGANVSDKFLDKFGKRNIFDKKSAPADTNEVPSEPI